MIKSTIKLVICIFVAMAAELAAADFRIEGKSFLLDGKPFQIRSGEIHYSRVPKEEWRNRIRMAKAMGLNTICTYVFWNLHETKRGEYDFSGDKDVVSFVRLCAEEGMQAIVRPGPFVAAEWDLGGIPAWLLAEPGIKLRTTDVRFLAPAKAWMKLMGAKLQPLSVANGGPLLMVQVENEYGLTDWNSEYLAALEGALREGGYDGTVFTSDPAFQVLLRRGGLPGVLKAANFGSRAEAAFQALEKASPGQPSFSAEFWVGWFDQWGSPRGQFDLQKKVADLEWMMSRGASFNIYMFHGGTTRGLWSSAAWLGEYQAVTCSHDWAAPLDESGRPTEKYFAFRAVIQRFLNGESLPEIPNIPEPASVGDIRLSDGCNLIDAIPKGQTNQGLSTMEDLGQSTGFILYRTTVEGPIQGNLNLGAVKDRVYVVVNGQLTGFSGRSTSGKSPILVIPEGKHRLDLLVENMGRISYSGLLNEERKGLTTPVMLADKEIGPFEQVSLPMQDPPPAIYHELLKTDKRGSFTLYRGRLQIESSCDTWLDMRGFGRGIVWFNGRNLGRYWKAGPPRGIFLPGCWMKPGEDNELVVLELESDSCPSIVPTNAKPLWSR